MLTTKKPTYRLYEKSGKIYIDYRKNGQRHRKSLGLDYTQKNLKSVEKNIDRVLLNFNDKIVEKKRQSLKLKEFGLNALDYTSINRSDRTQADYISKFQRHILPIFGDMHVDEIKVMHIDMWQQELLQKYSTTTVKRCKMILKLILDRALANELITFNPVEHTQKFRLTHKQTIPYELDEMIKLLKYSSGWLRIMLWLGFTTGMRPGELLGLKWSDINFEQCTIRLKRSISKGIVTEDTCTKNHNRLIIFPKIVGKMLKEYKNTRTSDISRTSPIYGLCKDSITIGQARTSEDFYLFTNKYGKPFYESKSIVTKHLQPLMDELSIENKGLKAMRHTYISIMRNNGVSKEFITDLVGHSAEVQDKHYYQAEITKEKTNAVNNVFDGLLDKVN